MAATPINIGDAIIVPLQYVITYDAMYKMWFVLYYLVAIVVMVMHFTGLLARYNVEWLMLVLAVTVFPAVIYL